MFLGQMLNLFGLLADRRESWECMPREVVLCQNQEFVDQGFLLTLHPTAIGSAASTCTSLQEGEVVLEVLTRNQVNASGRPWLVTDAVFACFPFQGLLSLPPLEIALGLPSSGFRREIPLPVLAK